MQNLPQVRPQVKNSPSTTIARTRAREKATPISLRHLIVFMTTEPWDTADAVSDMFERRYRLRQEMTEAQCLDIYDIRRINLDGSDRIEFMLCGNRITLYPVTTIGGFTGEIVKRSSSSRYKGRSQPNNI